MTAGLGTLLFADQMLLDFLADLLDRLFDGRCRAAGLLGLITHFEFLAAIEATLRNNRSGPAASGAKRTYELWRSELGENSGCRLGRKLSSGWVGCSH